MEDETPAEVRDTAKEALTRREHAEEEGEPVESERIWAVPTVVLVRAATDTDAVAAIREESRMWRKTDEGEDGLIRMVVQSNVAVWVAAEDPGGQS